MALTVLRSFPGGAADKSGLLHVRDQILAINDQDITHMARIEAWNMLKKQPDGMVRLTIRKWLPQGPGTGTDSSSPPVADSATSPATAQPSSGQPGTTSAETPAAESQPTAPGRTLTDSVATVSRPSTLPAGGRGDTRPVITAVTPKSTRLTSPAVILPQA